MKYRLLFAVLVILASLVLTAVVARSEELILSDEERDWIASHPVLKVGNEMDWPPFDFVEEGEAKGYSIDFVRLLGKKTGLRFEFVNGFTWAELMTKLKQGEIDILPVTMDTPERREFMIFTSHYLTNPTVLVVHEDTHHIKTIEDVRGGKLAIVQGYYYENSVREGYPDIEVIPVSGFLDGLEAVLDKQVDAFIGSRAVVLYTLKKHFLSGLRIAGRSGVDDPDRSNVNPMSMGVRKDQVILRSILEKGLASITEEEKQRIAKRWIDLELDADPPEKLTLTAEEKAWLVEHRDIRLGVDPTWPPFEFFGTAGVYEGIASDYVSHLNKQLNINMTPVLNLSWSQVMDKARAGKIDVLPCVVETPERSKFLFFTRPYLSFPTVILTRQDAPFVNGVQDFASGKVAVVKGYYIQEIMERDYPDRRLYLANDIEEALLAVSKGKIDAYVGNLASTTYVTQKLGLTNLKVATTMPYMFELGFAVRKDWPELVGILNKSMHSISDSERTRIHNHWINVRFERQFDWAVVFKIVIPIVVVGVVILLVFIRWNRTLSREVAERKLAEEALRESRAAARGLLDATQESLLLLDSDGNIVAANQSAAQRLQKTLDELNGANLFTLLPEDLSESRKANFEKVLRTGSAVFFEDKRDRTVFHNNYFPVQATTGEVAGVAIFAQDITDRKMAEDELRRNMEDLERFSKMAVGREERMIELKEEINELLKEFGQSEKYKIMT
ncbi:MAG: transporter substrate-binding domain-containing protein [Planctomycetota bacterium]